MTEVIHRHEVPTTQGPFDLPIFPDAQIVHVGTKPDGSVHLWEKHQVDIVRTRQVPRRTFVIVGTGARFQGEHRGTFIDGPFVWHVIEVAS